MMGTKSYFIILLSTLFVLLFNSYIYDTIFILLINLTIYVCFSTWNHRNALNYIMVSSFTYLLFIIAYLWLNNFYSIAFIFIIITMSNKIPYIPFIFWSFSIYTKINIYLFLFITIISKTLFLCIMQYVIIHALFALFLYCNIVIISVLSYFLYDFMILLICSGSLQFLYLSIPYLYSFYYFAIIYYILYVLSILLLVFNMLYDYKYMISYILLFAIMFSYFGIPPFIGFYIKLYAFNYISSIYMLIFVIIATIISTWMYVCLFNLYILLYDINMKLFSRVIYALFSLFIWSSLYILDLSLII